MTPTPKNKTKEASPQQFIFMGMLGITITGMIHGITHLASGLSWGMGFTMYSGLYMAFISFFIIGLACNKHGSFRKIDRKQNC